jgi:hypothetical protein
VSGQWAVGPSRAAGLRPFERMQPKPRAVFQGGPGLSFLPEIGGRLRAMAKERRTRFGRRAGMLAGWLAIGLAANAGVAWGVAVFWPQEGWDERMVFVPMLEAGETPRLPIVEYTSWGAIRRTWDRPRKFAGTWFSVFNGAIDRPLYTQPLREVKNARLRGMSWGNVERLAANPDQINCDGCEHATGWPMLAAYYEIAAPDESGVYSVRGGMLVQKAPPVFKVSSLRAIPFIPIWPGFALNTLFYAALAWGLWQLPLAIRRRRRRTTGRCVACGYDLKGLAVGAAGEPGHVCPECGGRR